MTEKLDLVISINRYSALLPLTIFFIRSKSLLTSQKWLAGPIIWAAMSELIGYCTAYYLETNLPFYHLYVAIEFSLLVVVFYNAYPGLISKKYLIYSIPLFCISAVLNVLLFQPLTDFASHTRTLESCILLFLSIRYFFLVLKELKVKNIERTFAFWFSTAILVYFSSNLLLFIYSNVIMVEEHSTFMEVWAMHSLLNILLYLFYAIALWQKE
ncbi:MAG: hypothetical protein AB8H47_04565 [Bacteroidia bacterium]